MKHYWKLSRAALMLAVSVLVSTAEPAGAASTVADIQKTVAAAGAYDYGQPVTAFLAIDRLIAETYGNTELRAALERELVKLLKSDTPLACKQEICRRLWIIGTDASVPALAKLLALPDAHIVEAACYALSQNPSPAVDAALRDALGQVEDKANRGALGPAKSRWVIAVINLLVDRRDALSPEGLSMFIRSADAATAEAAIAALGKIATPKAINVLRGPRSDMIPAPRVAAGHALLQAGQELVARGREAEAREVFATLTAASDPPQVRRGAFLERVRLGGPEATALVLSALRGNDAVLQAAAIASIPAIRGETVTTTFAAELPKLPAAQQALLIEALADRGDPLALPAITQAAAHPEPVVRLAALKALGQVGDVSSVPVLIRACGANNVEAAKVAALALRMIKGDGIAADLIGRLPAAEPRVKLELINVLADRRAAEAVPVLLAEARSDNAAIATAALQALGQVAGDRDLPALIQLLAALKTQDSRTDAERALLRVAQAIADPSRRSDALLAALRATRNVPEQCSLLRVLAGIADEKSYLAVADALQSSETAVKDAAVHALCEWPDLRAEKVLLGLMTNSADDTHRVLTLRGYVRLVDQAEDRPPLEKARLFAAALTAAPRPEDKKLIFSGLARVHDPAALKILVAACDDPAARNEAAVAAIAVARQLPPAQAAAVRTAMLEIAGTVPNTALRSQARSLIAPATAAGVPGDNRHFAPLFDGQTFDGWEGNLEVFRLEAGAIVGGSLTHPVTRNEFLCTRKEYGNFELWLQCRLLGQGANAGVQIRSRRVPNHFELSGYQADMGQQYWGNLYDESRRNRTLAGPPAAEQSKFVRDGDWNDYVIRCQGRRIQLWVNGQPTADYTEPDASLPQTGIIGVQIHGGPPSEAWYKDILLRPLPDP